MASDSEVQTETNLVPKRFSIPAFRRLISTESSVSSTGLSVFEVSQQEKPKFNRSEFLLKIFQLITSVTSAGLYSNGMRMMEQSTESMMFPTVVFGAYIIITSVIALSYVLGSIMPPILIRIFNTIGMTLYFASGCVTTSDWYKFARFKEQPDDVLSANMLLGESCMSFVNVCLYGCDIYISVRNALKV